MGTNYYAHWTPPESNGIRVTLHICKSLVSFNGQVFPDWATWKSFLLHGDTTERVVIENEYGVTYEAAEFVDLVEGTSGPNRRRQYDWLVDHDVPLDRDWLDPENFSFHNGEFF